METVETKPALFRRKSTWRFIARSVVGIVILGILASFIDLSEIVSTLERANLIFVVLAFVLVAPNLFLQMLKWRVLLQSIDPQASFKAVSSSFLFGLAIGTLTPGQIGEYGGRALRLDTNRPGLAVGLTVLDKIQFMSVIIIGGAWSLAFLLDSGFVLLVSASAVLTACLLVVSLRPAVLVKILNRIGIGKIRRQIVRDILESFAVVGRKTAAKSLLLTLALYVLVLAQFYLLLVSFYPAPVFDASMGFAAALFAKSALPISIGDLGVREAAAIFFLSLREVPDAASFNASFLLSLMNIFLPAILGAFFVPKKISLRDWGTRTDSASEKDQ